MSTSSYIGIGMTPYECAAITATRYPKSSKYLIRRYWYQEKKSYKNIIQEVTESLKTMELSQEKVSAHIKSVKEKRWLQYDNDDELLEKWIYHYYSIIAVSDGKINHEIKKVDVKYKQINQELLYKYSEPKIDIEKSLDICCGLINDDLIEYASGIDLSEIIKEIDNLNAITVKNPSPKLVALSLAVGEAEYRALNDCEDLPTDLGAFNRGMFKVIEMLESAQGYH